MPRLGVVFRALRLALAAAMVLVGCDKAQPAPASGDASAPLLTLQDFSDGSWTLRVDRRYEPDANSSTLPTDPLAEESYHATTAHDYSVTVSEDVSRVSIGAEPWIGELTSDDASTLIFNLTDGTFAGGRFVVWSEAQGLQAELTLYGSGVPITQSERGTLVPNSR
jgi:hypothetical protein